MITTWLTLVGLVADVIGFSLIGWALLTHPENRLFLGGGDKEFNRERVGFILVITGFALQAVGQVFVLMGRG